MFGANGMSSIKKPASKAIVMTTWWVLWSLEDAMAFGDKSKQKKDLIFDSIIDCSFTWFVNKKKNIAIT